MMFLDLPNQPGAVNPKLGDFVLQSPFLFRTSHLKDLLLLICRNGVSITNAEGGDLWLRGGHFLHRCVSLNLPEHLIGDVILKVGRGPAGRAVAGGVPIVSEDLSKDTSVEYSEVVQNAGIHGFLAVPMLFGKDRIGVLTVSTISQPRKFTVNDISRLQLLADTAALAIDHCLRRPEATDRWKMMLNRLCDLFDDPHPSSGGPGKRQLRHHFPELPKSLHPVTLAKVYDFLLTSSQPVDSTTIAESLGLSQATARRYANYLVEIKAAEMELQYGSVGRPRYGYTIQE